MLHGGELIEDLLFTNSEALVRLSFSLYIFKLNGVVEAALMEVGSRFIIVHLLIHLRHLKEGSEAFARRCIAIEPFTGLEVLHDAH